MKQNMSSCMVIKVTILYFHLTVISFLLKQTHNGHTATIWSPKVFFIK